MWDDQQKTKETEETTIKNETAHKAKRLTIIGHLSLFLKSPQSSIVAQHNSSMRNFSVGGTCGLFTRAHSVKCFFPSCFIFRNCWAMCYGVWNSHHLSVKHSMQCET